MILFVSNRRRFAARAAQENPIDEKRVRVVGRAVRSGRRSSDAPHWVPPRAQIWLEVSLRLRKASTHSRWMIWKTICDHTAVSPWVAPGAMSSVAELGGIIF